MLTRLVYSGGRSLGRQPSRSMNPLNCSVPLNAVCNGPQGGGQDRADALRSVPCWSAMDSASRMSLPAPARRLPRQVSG